MLCSMWILILCAISSYTRPNIWFISNTSWIILTAWPAQVCSVSFQIVPDLLRFLISSGNYYLSHQLCKFQPLDSPVPNKEQIVCRSLPNLLEILVFFQVDRGSSSCKIPRAFLLSFMCAVLIFNFWYANSIPRNGTKLFHASYS